MTAIIDQHGKLLFSITGGEEAIKLNTPNKCFAVEDPPNDNMYYENGWVNMPTKTSPHHTFDYLEKAWVDQRTLEDVKAQKWSEIKILRDSTEYGGFTYDGNIYDSDVKAQSRIVAASDLGVEVEWVTQDNLSVTLDFEQAKELRMALAQHISTCHERGRKARQLIFKSETIEQVELVNF